MLEISFSSRGTGACPGCKRWGLCPILKQLQDSLINMNAQLSDPLEVVVYRCPEFIEKS